MKFWNYRIISLNPKALAVLGQALLGLVSVYILCLDMVMSIMAKRQNLGTVLETNVIVVNKKDRKLKSKYPSKPQKVVPLNL